MKTNDLRIGNYVSFHDVWCKVVGIDNDRILIEYHNGDTDYCHIDYIDPIELTEELLVKLGFEGEMYEFCLLADDFNITVNLIENRVDISYFGNCEAELCIKYNVKYLHELQNLCYCITGQEIEIKL
jgi:hypothetical protein